MERKYKSVVFTAITVFCTIALIFISCKKETTIKNRIVQETYINRSGYGIVITRYLKDLPSKSFDIANNDTLIIEGLDHPNADITNTIRHADSAKVAFSDGKSYTMIDTTKTTMNFLQEKNFISTISANGKIHYLRFTLTSAIYDLVKDNESPTP